MIRIHLFAASAMALVAAPARRPDPTTFSPQRLSQHVQTLGSDAFEGRGPATARRNQDGRISHRPVRARPACSPAATWSTASGSGPRRCRCCDPNSSPRRRSASIIAGKAMPLTQGEQIAVRAPTNGDKAMAIDNAPLVFVGYGVKAPERGWDDFKGAGRPRQDHRRAGQRPRLRRRRGRLRRQGDDLLRPLDLQISRKARGRAPRASWSSTRPSRPATAGRRSRTPTPTPCSTSSASDPAAEHPPLEGWIQRDLAAQLFAASGTSFEAMKAAARRKDFRPVPLKATLDVRRRRQDRGHHLAQRRRHPAAARRGPTRRSSIPRTGTISASACPTRTATASTMARSTTAPASPS